MSSEINNSHFPVKVSVCLVTYNQDKYIDECLKSIVAQETDFMFEVIVADDCSTDGTREIIKKYAAEYPNIVVPVLREKNIGAYKNFTETHDLAQGQYICHCDGDDYWLPGKLQAQAEYLDQHPSCNIVWHRMLVLNDTTGVMTEDLIDFSMMPKTRFDRGDILRFNAIGLASSKMYRSAVRAFDPPGFPVMDFFANVEHVGSGYACFVGNEPLGVYRYGVGIASSGIATKKILQKSFLYFSEKYPEHRRDIACAALVWFLAALKNRKWSNCKVFAGALIKTFQFSAMLDLWRYRSIIAMLRIPSAIRRGER